MTAKFLNNKIYFSVLCIGILVPVFLALSQQAEFVLEKDCPILVENIDAKCNELGPEKCKEVLGQCEKFYQSKSESYKGEISSIQAKKKTLQTQISSLDTKIKSLSSQINKNNLLVKDLNLQITDTQSSIDTTIGKIGEIRQNLADLIQLQNEEDHIPAIEMLLIGSNFSSFFEQVIELESINDQTQELLKKIEGLKNNLITQQDSMENEKGDLEKVIIQSSLQKQESAKTQAEKQKILTETKGKESLYQQYLKDTEKKASEIRKKIFELVQVSGNQAINLEQAYEIAKDVEKTTGVRAALLLGLLKQESAIGKNVGQCNCSGATVCRNPDLHFPDINPSARQFADFKQITSELGMDVNKAPVSCFIDGGKVQFGGAMGPGQFMPSTWLGGYKTRIENLLGVSPASPWRVRDAFFASGLYLSDNGASAQTYNAEFGAATSYLCGTKKMTSSCIRAGGRGYVYAIMQFATEFQDYIDKGILK